MDEIARELAQLLEYAVGVVVVCGAGAMMYAFVAACDRFDERFGG